jgi:hypothetical protein
VKSVVAIVILSLPLIASGQSPSAGGPNSAAEIRAQEILRSLESNNTLRYQLERGARGDGIHHAWMDLMKRYGIRQASFVLEFKWNDRVESVKIKKVVYVRHYYRYDTQVKDGDLLRQVRDSGLEQDLHEAILVRARESVPEIVKSFERTIGKHRRKVQGTLYLNILDDEVLPILDEMPQLKE